MDINMKTFSEEHKREIELEDAGFEATGYTCPNCGTFLWEKSSEVDTELSEEGTLTELTQECPHCGYGAVSYDG